MKVAIGFNGQGIQNRKMYLELKEAYKGTESIIQKANQILSFDLEYVLQHEDLINKVEYTQVIVYIMNYISYQYLIEEMNIHPSIVLGHSLGHYNALMCAGVFSFEDALKIVEQRAYLTKQCIQDHLCGLFAIKDKHIDIEKVCEMCKQLSLGEKKVQIAIINSHEEIVIAYYDYYFEELIEYFDPYYLKKLNVSAPYHSSALEKIAASFYAFLNEFHVNQPKIPVISNCSGTILTKETIKHDLVLHLTNTIDMQRCVQYIKNYDVSDLIEVSSARVISKIAKSMENIHTYTICLEEEKMRLCNHIKAEKESSMLQCFMELYGYVLSIPERERYLDINQLKQYYAKIKESWAHGKVDRNCFAEFLSVYHNLLARAKEQLPDEKKLLLQYHLGIF